MATPLAPNEVVLESEDLLLWRSCAPEVFLVDDGRLSSQAFALSSGDENRLSVGQSYVVSAEEHFDELTNPPFELQKATVWGVSVDEVRSIGSRAVDDTRSAYAPDPCPKGHAFVDYGDLNSNGQRRKRAKQLSAFATARGRQHPTGS